MSTEPRRWVKLFKPQFAAAVSAGTKCQTVRPWPKRDSDVPEVGDVIDCRQWSALPYRSKQIKLLEGRIYEVQGVTICEHGVSMGPARVMLGKPAWRYQLSLPAIEALAKLDGFACGVEMIEWFKATHGLPFDGVLVRWKPKADVLTHHAPHCSPAWLAIHVPTARKVLAGYTDANFTDIGQLMCDYCNVLEQAGVLHYGDTEADAVRLAQPNLPREPRGSTTSTPKSND